MVFSCWQTYCSVKAPLNSTKRSLPSSNVWWRSPAIQPSSPTSTTNLIQYILLNFPTSIAGINAWFLKQNYCNKWCIDIKIAPNLWYNKITVTHQINHARRGANLMIYQNTEIENTQNQFSNAIKELQIGKLLRKANITKNCGVPAYEVFQFYRTIFGSFDFMIITIFRKF